MYEELKSTDPVMNIIFCVGRLKGLTMTSQFDTDMTGLQDQIWEISEEIKTSINQIN